MIIVIRAVEANVNDFRHATFLTVYAEHEHFAHNFFPLRMRGVLHSLLISSPTILYIYSTILSFFKMPADLADRNVRVFLDPLRQSFHDFHDIVL